LTCVGNDPVSRCASCAFLNFGLWWRWSLVMWPDVCWV
jgi:hypothetical protein